MTLSVFSDSHSQLFVTATVHNWTQHFAINELDLPTRIKDACTEGLKHFRTFSLQEGSSEISSLAWVKIVLTNQESALRLIAEKLGSTIPEGEFAGFEHFSELIDASEVSELDLSNSDLRSVPPQISLFTNLKMLDLRANPSLFCLPPELEDLHDVTVMSDF